MSIWTISPRPGLRTNYQPNVKSDDYRYASKCVKRVKEIVKMLSEGPPPFLFFPFPIPKTEDRKRNCWSSNYVTPAAASSTPVCGYPQGIIQ
jgi:hypothetical protein